MFIIKIINDTLHPRAFTFSGNPFSDNRFLNQVRGCHNGRVHISDVGLVKVINDFTKWKLLRSVPRQALILDFVIRHTSLDGQYVYGAAKDSC